MGDQLRTANGKGATVVALRYHVGTADVYTLTVGQDHTFFAGPAQVLVHNGDPFCGAKVNVSDPALQNIVNSLWRPHSGAAVIGGGSAIDALINEAATGLPTKGVWHDQKISELATTLFNWIRAHPSAPDTETAQLILMYANDALTAWKASPYTGLSGHVIP